MISVVVPCYNYGHLIADTIRSVQQQTYTDWELIIVDDGSTDNTAEIVHEFINQDKRIQFYQQQNAGPSAARNFALKQAKGEYIQFLDADDCIEKGKFEIQLSVFQNNPEADIVYGSVRYFKKNPADKSEWHFTHWGADKEWMPGISGKGEKILPAALKGSFAHISTLLFKRAIVDKAGTWDTAKRAAEDYLFLLHCVLENGCFVYHNMPGSYALVRWHGANTSNNTTWIHEGERQMRIELMPVLEKTGNKEAVEINANAIKALDYMNRKTWRKKMLSGGPFDSVKKVLRYIGLEKIAKRIFYK